MLLTRLPSILPESVSVTSYGGFQSASNYSGTLAARNSFEEEFLGSTKPVGKASFTAVIRTAMT